MRRKTWKMGICVLLIGMFLANVIPVNASTYNYDIVWTKNYSSGYTNNAVAIDSNDNIIVCGIDDNYKGMILKYDKNGNLLWSVHITKEIYHKESKPHLYPTPSIPDVIDELQERGLSLFAVVTDSSDNIIVAGSFFDNSKVYSDIRVMKYSPSGTKLWEKKFSLWTYSFAQGVDVDSNNNIFVAGWVTNGADAKGLLIKIRGSDGYKLWQYERNKLGKIVVYTDVVVDSSNNPITAGMTATKSSEPDKDVIITKYSGTWGIIKREKIRAASALPYGVAIDKQGNFVIAGVAEYSGIQSHYLLRLSSSFNVLWEKQRVVNGGLTDVTIMKNGDIAVSGEKNSVNEYYAAIYSINTGSKLLDMYLGNKIGSGKDAYNDYMWGIASDNTGYLYVVGACPTSKTIKVHVT